jgi:hypothetical protein
VKAPPKKRHHIICNKKKTRHHIIYIFFLSKRWDAEGSPTATPTTYIKRNKKYKKRGVITKTLKEKRKAENKR